MKILLAIDGSEYSLAAVDEVARRPWPAGSSVKIVSVVELPFLPTTDTWALHDNYFSRLEEAGREQAQLIVDNAKKRIQESQGPSFEVSTQITEGHTVSEILGEANGMGADLIIVGSHGYRGLKHFLLGSVSNA